MASMGQYARVAENEGEDVGMLSKERSSGPHPVTTEASAGRRAAWWKWLLGAIVVVALIIPAVLYTFSSMLESRVADRVQTAIAARPEITTTATVTSVSTTTAVTTATLTETITSTTTTTAGATPSKPPPQVLEDEEYGHTLTLTNGSQIVIENAFAGQRFEMRHCGGNADEARALGCAYDVMMQEWTPPDCIDWSLSERYLKNGNWTWYADSNAETVYDDVEIAKGNHDVVYVDQSYHRHHCIFAWERLVRAMRTQRPMIQKLIDYDHFKHCRHNTLKTFEEGAEAVRGVVAPTGFTKCASYDVWLEALPANQLEHIKRMMEEF